VGHQNVDVYHYGLSSVSECGTQKRGCGGVVIKDLGPENGCHNDESNKHCALADGPLVGGNHTDGDGFSETKKAFL
jgi:hypothetical protein